MEEARSFKANFSRLQLRDFDFAIGNGKLMLSNFTIVNPGNNRSYVFNSNMPTTYNITAIERFYTERLGTGVPRATQAVFDASNVIRNASGPVDSLLKKLEGTTSSSSNVVGGYSDDTKLMVILEN